MGKRAGNRPERRFIQDADTNTETRKDLCARLRYVGSGNHKLRPGDYGFQPSHNPRPSKSPCDLVRAILLNEATSLMRQGIRVGMISQPNERGIPKYVWAVDEAGDVYEAKTRPEHEVEYHGYRLGDDDSDMRSYILKEWKKRCRQD